MATKKMVTRTFNSTKVKAMFVDTETASVETREFSVPYNIVAKGGAIKEGYEKALVKAIERMCDGSEKLVKLISAEPVFELRGMTEEQFFAHSEVLPPRTNAETTDNN